MKLFDVSKVSFLFLANNNDIITSEDSMNYGTKVFPQDERKKCFSESTKFE